MDNMSHINYYFLSYLLLITAYPIEKIDSEGNSDLNDERRYPNGTVVGSYTYKDKDGNPVHVKYFADESSYGVELKSFKQIDTKYDTSPESHRRLELPFKIEITPDTEYPLNNAKIGKSFELFDDKTQPKPKSDFEIFMENDMQPEKCGTEKVRVYYDKNNKRKIRNVFNPYETFNFCQRF